ncbi:hypothetical protein ScPMuIL_006875 [Solemya velum]
MGRRPEVIYPTNNNIVHAYSGAVVNMLTEKSLNKLVPSTLLLEVVHADTYMPLTLPVEIGTPARLKFTMADEAWTAGNAVGARLTNCRFGNNAAFTSNNIIIDGNGCPTGPANDEAGPFVVTTGFKTTTDAAGYDVSYTDGTGIKYVAASGTFSISQYVDSEALHFECLYEYCLETTDAMCFPDHCHQAKRRRRDVVPQNESTVWPAGGSVVSAAVLLVARPIASLDNNNDQLVTGASVKTDDCMQSMAFVVIVVVLLCVLAISLLVSLFLLYQTKKWKSIVKRKSDC